MGTVHAKSEGGRGPDLAPHEQRHALKLNGVRARVDRVHVDGLNRTRDDVIKSAVNEMFLATDFEDVIMRAHRVRGSLESLGCFRDIGVSIDVSSGPHATPDGLEVTFAVQELSRVVGGVSTTVSDNEGNLVVGVKLPNVLGRGERVSAEYAVGHRRSCNCSLLAAKPLLTAPLAPVLSASLYQQNSEYPWSGYRLLDRGLLTDLAFSTSPSTKHNLQWEGLIRETTALSKSTSFRVRESSGPQMKSTIRHIVCVDRRDDPVFPTRGAKVRFLSEVAGVGGGVAALRADLVLEGAVPLVGGALSATAAAGLVLLAHGAAAPDRLYLGGPATLRGFRQRGVGPHEDQQAQGGKVYVCGTLHGWWGLPFVSRRGPLSQLLRSHAFISAGSLADNTDELLPLRVSCGLGVAARLGGGARLELAYCVPLRAAPGDRTSPGLQLGLGTDLL